MEHQCLPAERQRHQLPPCRGAGGRLLLSVQHRPGNIISPKGSGATGDPRHGTEILLHPKLLVDVGKLVGLQPHKLEAGVGYEYWHNKFGNTPPIPGTEQNSVFVEAGYHF